MDWLKEEDACNLDECAAFIGEGIEVTKETILQAHKAGILNIYWLAARILNLPSLENFYTQQTPLSEEFQKKIAPFKIERILLSRPFLEAFKAEEARLLAEYKNYDRSLANWEEYSLKVAAARKEYDAKIAPFWDKYNTQIAPFWREYETQCAQLLAALYDQQEQQEQPPHEPICS